MAKFNLLNTELGAGNPGFAGDLKWLLKYGPAVVPFSAPITINSNE
jgi:hypothetical protein